MHYTKIHYISIFSSALEFSRGSQATGPFNSGVTEPTYRVNVQMMDGRNIDVTMIDSLNI